ncbi:16S rRNA (guanine(966)-N(2))-methyltransferase RsmD [Gilvimarinus sp. DA14]|uniref:16S rRNA (guanine(966)-N(2))-methyltransferase RsmD n=1 Tax=Gilvimarinus sp. DA14 TaxID=2956798 RepID=UPI0020B6FFB7|nr:16S rRNA (guanine(966)-N(2))-methyltransferase RsmD [Gilvimarinus sp. DA14]UTF58634.1 16S rRNA (guanine(966)-N(2))-methyltransferase RsmD [Gilvimarinus sp. DA14]
MANSRNRAQKTQTQTLRIIGGRHRGRKLPFASVDGLRPTGDRIRETLFNWLAPHLPGARCLDLFAGSGALGLEALSRGAAEVLMCERDSQAAACIADSLNTLQESPGHLYRGDSLTLLATAAHEPYEVVFLDPPFAADLWQACIDRLQPWLADEAMVYIESGIDTRYQVPEHWHLHRDKRAGKVRYCLYRVETPERIL